MVHQPDPALLELVDAGRMLDGGKPLAADKHRLAPSAAGNRNGPVSLGKRGGIRRVALNRKVIQLHVQKEDILVHAVSHLDPFPSRGAVDLVMDGDIDGQRAAAKLNDRVTRIDRPHGANGEVGHPQQGLFDAVNRR